jgi:hypothetical protein
LRLGIEAGDADAALAIFRSVLTTAGLQPASDPIVARTGQVWSVQGDLDMPADLKFEPDIAQARMNWLADHFAGDADWVTRVRQARGSYHWPPPAWDRKPGDQLAHPAVREALLHVAASRN